MKRLLLIRHGESEWNAQRRIQGQAGGGLSPRGHEQARLTAAALAEQRSPVRLLVSDLVRARETAAPISAALRLEAEVDVGLRERDFGRWAGVLRRDAQTEDPEIWRRWAEGEDVIGELGGESSQAFGSRVDETLGRILAATSDDEATVVVAHGGPIWHGCHQLLDLRPGTLGGVANASITEIDVDGPQGRWLERWNETGHLPPELRTTFRPSDTRSTQLDGYGEPAEAGTSTPQAGR